MESDYSKYNQESRLKARNIFLNGIQIICCILNNIQYGRAKSTIGNNPMAQEVMVIEASLTFRGCVMPWQCDQMGHMNARHIYACFDDATGVFAAQLGADFGQVASSGLGWADVRQEVEFFRELRNGSAVTVATTLLALGRSSIEFRHDLTLHDSTEAAARMTCKTVRFNIATRRSAPIDDELRKGIAKLLSQEVKL